MAKKGLWVVIGGLGACIIVLLYLLLGATRGSGAGNTPRPDTGVRQDTNPVVARIGSEQIMLGELQDQLYRSYGIEMISQMLERRAIKMEAESTGIKVSPEEIDNELRTMSQGYDTVEEFYKAMREQLGLTKEALREDANYKLLLEKIATKSVKVTDEQVFNYIRSHQEEFKVKTEYHIQQMILPSREHAEKALNELANGESFSVLVRDRSVDEASKATDGDLGWVAEDDPFVPHEILDAVQKLQPGKVSGIIATNEGFAIVKLLERRTETKESEDVIRERVRKQLALQEAPPLKEVVQALKIKYGAEVLDKRFIQ